MRAVRWLCRERTRSSLPQSLAQTIGVVMTGFAFASERDSSPARSKALFEPMVGIRLVVEGFHFLVSAVSVQLDGFNEGAVRFQVKNRNSRFPCVALQSLEETPPQPKTTRPWSDPHALDLSWSVLVKLQRTTADRLLSQTCHEHQASGGCEFVCVRRNAESWIETDLEAFA